MSAGMTVLPVRSTRVAPADGWRSPLRPTHVNESPSTRNAELSMTGVRSPTMSRAPSNHRAGRRACAERRIGRLNARARGMISVRERIAGEYSPKAQVPRPKAGGGGSTQLSLRRLKLRHRFAHLRHAVAAEVGCHGAAGQLHRRQEQAVR